MPFLLSAFCLLAHESSASGGRGLKLHVSRLDLHPRKKKKPTSCAALHVIPSPRMADIQEALLRPGTSGSSTSSPSFRSMTS